MALAWKHSHAGITYEVRTAGSSVRLYTNGAFHSQYSPKHQFTGAIWDLLTLPSLCTDTPPERALLLGVGGGTAIHQLYRLHPIQELVGVEIDPVHIQVARNHFGIRYPGTHLVCDDAMNWLKRHDGRFDYLIDDIFQHGEEDPSRPFEPGDDWTRLLVSRINQGGIIVQNHIEPAFARESARSFGKAGLKTLFFENEGYMNCVVAAFDTGLTTRTLRSQLQNRINRFPASSRRRLRYRVF